MTLAVCVLVCARARARACACACACAFACACAYAQLCERFGLEGLGPISVQAVLSEKGDRWLQEKSEACRRAKCARESKSHRKSGSNNERD